MFGDSTDLGPGPAQPAGGDAPAQAAGSAPQPPADGDAPAQAAGSAPQPPAGGDAPAQPPAGESDEALLERMSAELDGIERMLGRLDDGSFAMCDLCGAELGRERLLANPVLTRCPAH